MKFGITIPNNWGVEDPQQVLALGPLAEELGYDSLWVMDHLFNTGYIRERLEDRPYYHPLATLSYLAATTKRINLGTSVLVRPYHNPVELAKYAATLDQISGGRVILGVGAGAMAEEFLALGIPMRRRGLLTDESIAIMKELWTNPYPSYHSRRWEFSDLRFSPKPLQKPHIPLWVGGSSTGALRRAANQGDGWHPTGLSPEEFSMGRREVRELAVAAGRDPDGLTMSVRMEVEMGEIPPNPPLRRGAGGISSASARTANRARVPGDDPAAIIAAIEAYRSVGVEHIVLAPNSGDVPGLTATMERIAKRVLPQFR